MRQARIYYTTGAAPTNNSHRIRMSRSFRTGIMGGIGFLRWFCVPSSSHHPVRTPFLGRSRFGHTREFFCLVADVRARLRPPGAAGQALASSWLLRETPPGTQPRRRFADRVKDDDDPPLRDRRCPFPHRGIKGGGKFKRRVAASLSRVKRRDYPAASMRCM